MSFSVEAWPGEALFRPYPGARNGGLRYSSVADRGQIAAKPCLPYSRLTFSLFGCSKGCPESRVNRIFAPTPQDVRGSSGHPMRIVCLIIALMWCGPAFADLRIPRDFGGYVEEYKTKYAKVKARGERVVIDGICNSACTLVLGIVPLNRICAT